MSDFDMRYFLWENLRPCYLRFDNPLLTLL